MADIKWIKIATDIFDDEKILLIESMPDAYAIIVVWFKLLCLAGKQNNGGIFVLNDKIPYTEEMLATIMRMPLATVRLALQTFEAFGMVEIVDGTVTIPKWSKHQSFVDKKEYDRLAQQRHRAKLPSNVNDIVNDKSLNVKDKNKEERNKKEKERTKESKRFAPPSVDEVRKYCQEKGYRNVDPEGFVAFYESKGWKVGNQPMKSWKAATVTWERRDKKEAERPLTKLERAWGNRDDNGRI